MVKKNKQTLLAISASLALGLAFMAPAVKAGVLGSSVFGISNFFLINQAGDVPTGVTIVQGFRNGEMAVGLNGVNNSDTGNVGAVANLDLQPIWLGANPTGNNAQNFLPDGTGTFSRSDLFVSGNVFTAGAAALTRSDAYALGPTNEGNANSTIANSVLASYEINVAADSQLQFQLDADGFLRSLVTADLFGSSSNANASISFSIDVSDSNGVNVLHWAPNELNRGVSAVGVATFNDVGGAFSYDDLSSGLTGILAGTYNVTIQQKSTARENASAVAVPEPSIIALLAVGLIGFGFTSRRAKKVI